MEKNGVGRGRWEGGVAVTGGAADLASVEMQSDNSTISAAVNFEYSSSQYVKSLFLLKNEIR